MASSESNASGTSDPASGGRQQSKLIRALTTCGFLTLVAYLANLVRQIDLAWSFAPDSALGGLWERRIEALSFLVYPQNVVILAPAVAAGIVATILAGPLLDLRTAVLLRITRWTCALSVGLALVSTLSIMISDGSGIAERGALAFRLGGAILATGFIIVLRAVEDDSPAG